MRGQTLEEALEQRIFEKLEAKLHEVETNTKKQIDDLQADTDTKIKRLRSSEKSVEWRCFKSGVLATDNPSEEDPSVFQLSQDVYSILTTASWRSVPFWISMLIIFGFQFSLLILLLANQVHVNSENPFNLPANVETPVRISQVLLIIIALLSQDDLLAGIESLVDGFPDHFSGTDRFVSMERFQWRLSSIIRLSQGLLNLLAAFVLSIQSETVPDVLLNVLGVGFVSNLDDLAFRLGMKGFFGGSMKRMAEDLCDVQFHRTAATQNARWALAAKVKHIAHIIIAFAVLLAGIVAFTIFAVQQHIGMYSEQHIRIEFGDEVLPFLGLFNGCYQASDAIENIVGRLVYEQVGYPNGGKFGFCSDFGEGDSGWAFYFGEQRDDVCKRHILRSSETSTFSLLEAGKTNWYTSDDLPLDSLEITEVKTPTSECGQSMFKLSNSSCPLVVAFDTMTMSRLHVDVDIDSGRSLDATISHPIYRNNEGTDESFTLIFFSGRRWIQASSDGLRLLLGNESSVFSDIQDFFVNDGLYSFIDSMRAFGDDKPAQWVSAVSESVDTARDQGSPLGLQWYFPRYLDVVNRTSEVENLQRNFPTADLARPIDSSLACLYCNSESNPCLYDGVCDNENGKCDCRHGTDGTLCQILPLVNGICNLYFNNATYNYDEGDCCAGTCFGERCGEDDLPNPFSDAFTEGLYAFSNRKDLRERFKTFLGRDFAFGVDISSEDLDYIGLPPLRYSHCEDPRTALLTIQKEGVPPNILGGKLFASITVRCDGTLYLRTPVFIANTNLTIFAEKIRVPFGATCDVTVEDEAQYLYNVSFFAENKTVPFLQRMAKENWAVNDDDYGILLNSTQVPITLRIPNSDCVWTTFVENLVNVFTDAKDEENKPWLLMPWNDYLHGDEYTNFTIGAKLDYICSRDPNELIERYALWKISKSAAPADHSENFVGHVCDSQWYNSVSVTCCGRRVCDLAIRNSNPVPSEIGLVKSLSSLDLRDNQLTQLPSELGRLTSLTSLALSDNRLTRLPSELGRLTPLTSLDLASNQLTSLPSEIGNLMSLEGILLDFNQLASIPSEIGRLTSLPALSLVANDLTSLPPEIGKLASVTSLYLDGNRLTSLPSEVGNLMLLGELWAAENQLTSVPPEIGNLTSLTSLRLNGNRLTSIPYEIQALTSLSYLFLNDNQFTSIPSAIPSLTSLPYLSLEENNLTSLSPEIGRLTSLTFLSLNDNQLTSLSSEIGRLASLETLFLFGNQLTSLSSEIASLTSLRHLRLNRNKLTSIPSEIGNLISLRALFLHRNELTSLPSEIGDLSSLQLLNLFFNPLAFDSLPTEILKLPFLESLLVCGDDGGYGCGTSDGGDPSCSDYFGWFHPYHGEGCELYERYGYDSCESLSSTGNDGISNNEACCICGGGKPTNQGE